MTISQLELDSSQEYLKISDLENLFDLYIDKRNNLVFDINKTVYINVNPNSLPDYVCDSPMHWTTISYKLYSTTRLAWLLQKINRVDVVDIFKVKQPGEHIKYLPMAYVNDIIDDINQVSDYE